MSDNLDYINHIRLHAQTAPIPRGKQARFGENCRRGHSLSPGPLSGLPLVTTRGWVGRRSRSRRGRPYPKARPAAAVSRWCGVGLRWGFRGGPELTFRFSDDPNRCTTVRLPVCSRPRSLRFRARRRWSELIALMNAPSTTLVASGGIGHLEAQGIG